MGHVDSSKSAPLDKTGQVAKHTFAQYEMATNASWTCIFHVQCFSMQVTFSAPNNAAFDTSI